MIDRAYVQSACGEAQAKSVAYSLLEERDAAILRNRELLEVIWDLRKFIGETFYANVPHDRKPLPNSWYKETSKTYGDVLQEILTRVDMERKGDANVL